MNRMEELKKRIEEAAESYWTLGISAISDTEYDALVEELKALTGGEDSLGSPRVVSSGKVEHPVPMLSMQKVYDLHKVVNWVMKYAENSVILVMPKYDGIALVHYKNGVIATRGDGNFGEDVSTIARPLFRENPVYGYGECVCPLSEFQKMGGYGYKNPRNAVSGIMNSLDWSIHTRVRHLEFVPYRHIVSEVSPDSWRCPDEIAAHRKTKESWLLYHELGKAAELVRELARNYPLDGIVFRIADEELFYALGRTDHHWRGQIALKFANESTESVIEHIEWQEKNGTITPVAHVAPVTLGGAEITRVTLHNAARVREWDIRAGDRCRIERAGGVIPKVVRTWRGENSVSFRERVPDVCPSCGGSLRLHGARLYCPGCDR